MEDKALVRRQKDLKELLLASQNALRAVVPKHLDPERLARVALVAAIHTPGLLLCSAQSILLAVMQAAQLGLEVGGAMGHAYIIPYKGLAKFVPGYRGLIDIVMRSGKVWGMEARAVHRGDEFRYSYGLHPDLHHVPHDHEEPELTHAYAVARLKGADILGGIFDVMDRSAIERIRARSMTSKSNTPWFTDFDEMAKKSVVRRIVKVLPGSLELAAGLEADNRGEGADPMHNELLDSLALPELEATPAQPVEESTDMGIKEKLAVKAAEAREAKS